MSAKVRLAKFFMTRFQNHPVFDKDNVGLLQEVFNHPVFINGTDEDKNNIMLKSSQSKYENELDFPIDKYFGFDLRPLLKDKEVLDLGCLVGGRSIAWVERYGIKHLSGIDVDQAYIDSATQFSKVKKVDADFRFGYGEKLPYEDNKFDAIVTFDVFEHVQDLNEVLKECKRVLKPHGKLYAIFPSYFQPKEHHLSLVTSLPGLQYFFTGKTLVKAYQEVLDERGEDANWYKRSSADLKDYERCNTINGTTAGKFRKMVKQQGWKTVFRSRKPIGSVGRMIEKHKWLKAVSLIFVPFTYVPYLEDFVLQRITVVLEKP